MSVTAKSYTQMIDAGEVMIVGAGLAGLFAALKMTGPVTILTGSPLGSGASSAWAQGGVAAAIGSDDTPLLHAADTIAAGAGIVDPQIARILAEEAAPRIADLSAMGVPFDRDVGGNYVLGREAAHQRRRIVRVKGDRAGAAIMDALVARVRATPRIRVVEGFRAFRLIMADDEVRGVWATRQSDPGTVFAVRAGITILALGGVGGLFAVTTNPPQAAGHAIAMAAEAGAVIADPEFVQFHPTALDVGRDPAPLATEALRGEGAVLVNDKGERFMLPIHPSAELAPRDIVARGIFRQIQAGHRVFLDARASIGVRFPEAFPTVYAAAKANGIDPIIDAIPVAPAAHYHMGGIAVDPMGRTSLKGLWACGECSATGAHGANRLASNSLLEAVVFGHRAAMDASAHAKAASPRPLPPAPLVAQGPIDTLPLRRMMTALVGLERNADGLAKALRTLKSLREDDESGITLHNMATAGLTIAAAAYRRTESRGGHYRSDYRKPDAAWAHRTFMTLAEALSVAARAIAERPSRAQDTAANAVL